MNERVDGPYMVVKLKKGGVGIKGPGRNGEYLGMSMDQAERAVDYLNEGYTIGFKCGEAWAYRAVDKFVAERKGAK